MLHRIKMNSCIQKSRNCNGYYNGAAIIMTINESFGNYIIPWAGGEWFFCKSDIDLLNSYTNLDRSLSKSKV